MASSSEQLPADRITARVNRLADTNDSLLSALADLQTTVKGKTDNYRATPGSETSDELAGLLLDSSKLKQDIAANLGEAKQLANEYIQRGYSKAGSGAALYYKVAPGDTVGGLAQRFYVEPAELATDNGLLPPYVLGLGQTLLVRWNAVSVVMIRMSNQADSAQQTHEAMGRSIQAAIQQTKAEIDADTLRPTFGPLPPPRIPLPHPDLEFVPPGYFATVIEINGSKEIVRLSFLMQPISDSEGRQNRFQPVQTTAGFFVYRLGPAPFTLSLQGYLVETARQLERHAFIEAWRRYLEDQRDENGRFTNDYNVAVYHQGRRYVGVCAGVTFSGNAQQPFLRQYAFQFLVLEDDLYFDATVDPATSSRERKPPQTNGNTFNNPDLAKLSPGTIAFLAPVSRDP